jgi:hypothetical protein
MEHPSFWREKAAAKPPYNAQGIAAEILFLWSEAKQIKIGAESPVLSSALAEDRHAPKTIPEKLQGGYYGKMVDQLSLAADSDKSAADRYGRYQRRTICQ